MRNQIGALCALALVGFPLAARADDKVITDELASLKAAAKCEDAASPWRPWCIATQFATGAAGELPKGKILVGLTVELEKGKEVQALTDRVSFVALVVGSDGKVKLASVTPSNPEEQKMMAAAVMGVAVVFKGKATSAKIPADLARYLKSLKGEYAPTKAGAEWTWAGASASHLRKVGASWVVIEVPKAGNGVFATILTDAWE